MLIPDNGDSATYILGRMGDFTGVLTEQLGVGNHPLIGTLILLLAGAGMVVGCVRRPRLDVPLAALTLLSAAAVSTHFRMVGRYYFQIVPWILYFSAAAIVAAADAVRRPEVRRAAVTIAIVPLVFLVGLHAINLPGDIADARDFNAGGRQQFGPTDPAVTPIFAAVDKYTEPDAVIDYYRARTMTLYTDRRAIQTTSLDRMLQKANYYAQQRFSDYYQPELTSEEAMAAGMVPVWQDPSWILWRLPARQQVGTS